MSEAHDLSEDRLREIIAMWEARSGGQARMAAAMYRDILLTKQGRLDEANDIWDAKPAPDKTF
jgi:hypothetical protein